MSTKSLHRLVSFAVAGSALLLVASGCRSTTSADRAIVLSELDAERFAARVMAGDTTREEEHKFLLENRLAWRSVRSWRGLIHPGEEGPFAGDFQALLGKCQTPELRDLAWGWLALAITNPSLDLHDGRAEKAVTP